MKNCENCAFFRGGNCAVVLWADGRRVRIGKVKPDFRCCLWEEKQAEELKVQS